MLKCCHSPIALRFFISFLWLFNLMWKGVSDFVPYCILRGDILISKYYSYLETLWYILNFSFVWVHENVVVATICWHERHRDVLHWMHSPSVAFSLTFRSFSLSLIVFVPMICFNDVFLRKAMTGVALNTFPHILLIFIIPTGFFSFYLNLLKDVYKFIY